MRKLLRVGKDVKAGRSKVKELMALSFSELDSDVRLQLIQGLMHIGEQRLPILYQRARDRRKGRQVSSQAIRGCRSLTT